MRNSAARWADLLLMMAVLFGAIVRFGPTVLAGAPINDGGMFHSMMGELSGNRLQLPVFTSYNELQIPFAYPPLSLYAGAMLELAGIPGIEILRWLPALTSTISIIAFWWLAGLILESRSKASLAAAIYALMPRTFSWYVMGGGLSRSFGILFLLLTCASAWLLFANPSWRRVVATAVLGAGAVLSHPETALHAAAACGLLWLFRGRNRRAGRNALLVALGVIALCSPWWATIATRHGFDPFISAISTGAYSALFWVPLLTFNFAQEPFVTVLAALALIDLAIKIMERKWFLPAWVLLPFLIEPRSAPAIAVLPLAMLTASALAEFILPHLVTNADGGRTESYDWTHSLGRSAAARAVLGFVLIYGFFAAFAYDLSLARVVLPSQGRAAMDWARQNVPPDARFIVLSGASDSFADPSAEWFPVLAGRQSVNTLQGREWLLGRKFMPFLSSVNTLQACASRNADCLEEWAQANQLDFDYVYVEDLEASDLLPSKTLVYELLRAPGYSLIYERAGVFVFRRE